MQCRLVGGFARRVTFWRRSWRSRNKGCLMAHSLGSSKIAGSGSFLLVYKRVAAHWRAIVLLLILGFVAFIVAPFDEFVPFMLILFALLLLFIASQIFWIGLILDLGVRLIPGKPRRAWLAIMPVPGSSFCFLSNVPPGRLCLLIPCPPL